MNKAIGVLIVVMLAGLIGLYVIVFTKAEKIAYIDTGMLMEKSKDMQTLKKQLEAEKLKLKANMDTLSLEFENKLKDYEKNQASMSNKEKQLSQELLRSKQNELMQYQQAIEQKARQEEQKKSQEVLNKINAYISEYGEKNGYKLIFATSQGNIAYGDKGMDITDAIINGINGK